MAESSVSESFFCGEFFFLVILLSADGLYEWSEARISTMTYVNFILDDWGQRPENENKDHNKIKQKDH